MFVDELSDSGTDPGVIRDDDDDDDEVYVLKSSARLPSHLVTQFF